MTDAALPAKARSQTYTFFSGRFSGALIGEEFHFPAIPFDLSSGSADIKQQARQVHETLLKQQDTPEVCIMKLAQFIVGMLIRSRVMT